MGGNSATPALLTCSGCAFNYGSVPLANMLNLKIQFFSRQHDALVNVKFDMDEYIISSLFHAKLGPN